MNLTRRTFGKTLLGSFLGASLIFPPGAAGSGSYLQKSVPSSGEKIPIVGLGSWITFNVGSDPRAIASVAQVIEAFFQHGGRLIDSSPMYGSSQAVIGKALSQIGVPNGVHAVDKVWTNGRRSGQEQIEESLGRWRLPEFALLQVHNLRDWEVHLETLFEMKERGALKYVGVTTSHGRRHRALAHIMSRFPLDFVQLTYNMTHREAERRLLPLALERNIAVIANRPFDGGRLIRRLKKEAFPEWAVRAGLVGWPEFVLKFNASHRAITCSIPATTRVDHVRENMAACTGHLPEQNLRARMLQYVESL